MKTKIRTNSTAKSRCRETIETIVLLFAIALLLRTWFVDGLFTRVVTDGGSMAPTLIGLHRDVLCESCGHRFSIGTDVRPIGPNAVCPRCGYDKNNVDSEIDLNGDQLLIDRTAFAFRKPRRWEVVAFRDPGRADRMLVKRVVGLPDESILIRDGDVWVDGKIQRKTLAQQLAMAVLVHEADDQMDSSLFDRWRGKTEKTSWGRAGSRFANPAEHCNGVVDWLVYHHLQRVPGNWDNVRKTPITDELYYNQMRSRRIEELNIVSDLMLAFRVLQTFGHGPLLVRTTDGRDQFEIRIDPELSKCDVLRNGKPFAESKSEVPRFDKPTEINVSLFDRQLLIAIDNRPIIVQPFPTSNRPFKPNSQPLAIGTQGLGVQLDNIRVYRDLHYTHPIGPYANWASKKPYRTKNDEFFVIGDNSVISDDSRTWHAAPGVSANLLMGKPIVVFFPACHVQFGTLHFQVPNPTKIRYIR